MRETQNKTKSHIEKETRVCHSTYTCDSMCSLLFNLTCNTHTMMVINIRVKNSQYILLLIKVLNQTAREIEIVSKAWVLSKNLRNYQN